MAAETHLRPLWTVEELDGLPGDHDYEIWEGELVEMSPAKNRHNLVAENILWMFREFCRSRRELKSVGQNDGFLLRRNPDLFLSPDSALFRRRGTSPDEWFPFAPEIAVEVVSPTNSQPELAMKRRAYFECGTEQVWTVDPAEHLFIIDFPDRRRIEAKNGIVEGEGIVAGLAIDVDALFAEGDER